MSHTRHLTRSFVNSTRLKPGVGQVLIWSTFSIVSNEIKDGRAIGAVDEKRNKNIASKMGSKVEEQIRTKALEEDNRLESMSHNRINADRFKEERRYGYDPITNISYDGRLGVTPAPLRQEDKKVRLCEE